MYDMIEGEERGLELRNLVLQIGSRKLIDIPALSVTHPGVTVVMGANGAGKSVLLRVMHGLLKPNAGTVLCDGVPLNAASRRTQSLVLQNPVLLRRTTEANLRFVLQSRGLPRDNCRDLLEQVQLEGHCNVPARRLSGGEKQRLAIAQALATKPATLMLDEPTANLDPANTRLIEEIVRAVVQQGTRVILVTHDAGQARRLADEVVFIENGQVVEHASVPAFFDGPSTEASRDYLAGKLRG